MATEHYSIPEANRSSQFKTSDWNAALQKVDTEMWKLFQFRGDLGSADNLNDLSGSGFWRIGGSAPLNAPPSPTWGFVLQVVYGTLTHQYFFKPEAKAVMIRAYSGSPQVWSSWEYVGGYTAPVQIDYGNDSYVRYWKSGQTATIKVVYKVSDGTVSAWGSKEIAVLPSGFRPVETITNIAAVDRSGDAGTCVSVDSSGSVKISTRYNAFNESGDVLQCTFTYPIRY